LFINILVSNCSDLNATSPTSRIELKSTVPVQNLSSPAAQSPTVVSQSTTPKSSPLHYRNPRLERIVHAKHSKSQLSLNSMELVDQDMEILASYLLQNDTVRNS